MIDAAIFTSSLSVTIDGTGTGRVTSTPPGIDCPGACDADFEVGTLVTLQALPTLGSQLTGWGRDCATQPACTIYMMYTPRTVVATFEASPDEWVMRFGDVLADEGNGVTVAIDGRIVVAGVLSGGAYVESRGVDGALLWSRGGPDLSSSAAQGVALDAAGAAYVTGYFAGSVDFGGGDVVAAGADAFLASYDSAGAYLRASRYGGGATDLAHAVAATPDGSVAIAGAFDDMLDTGTGAMVSAGDADGFAAAFAPGGAPSASTRFGGALGDQARGVAIDSTGAIILVGTAASPMVDAAGTPTAGDAGAVVMKVAADGTLRWARRLGNATTYAGSVAVDASDDVYVAGGFGGVVDFGGGVITSAGGSDAFVLKLGATSGDLVWARPIGGDGNEVARALAVTLDGEAAIAGELDGDSDLGDGAFSSAGADDGFAVLLAADGMPLASWHFGGPGVDFAKGIAWDADHLVVTGFFEETANFFGVSLTSAGDRDGFVTRLAP